MGTVADDLAQQPAAVSPVQQRRSVTSSSLSQSPPVIGLPGRAVPRHHGGIGGDATGDNNNIVDGGGIGDGELQLQQQDGGIGGDKGKSAELEPFMIEQSSDAMLDDASESKIPNAPHVSTPGTSSTFQVIFNVLISFIGAGLLGTPDAFRQAGWLLASIVCLITAGLNLYCMLLLPKIKRALISQQGHTTTIIQSYGDIGKCLLGSRGETLVNVCLGVSQAGFATAYIIFIAANLKQELNYPRFYVCLACIPGLCVLTQFQRMKDLSIFSMLANFANACALCAVLFEDYESYQPHNDAIKSVKWGGALHVIAITIYSMEGVGLILSLESSCKNPNKFPMLLQLCIAGISLFQTIFGVAGYLAFGDSTMAPVTLNLAGSFAARFVKIALCLGLYLTFPVMMFPVWNISETIYPVLQENYNYRTMFRCGVVCTSVFVAYSVPNFGKFLSLVGSSICTILGFILPCYFALKTLELKRHERSLNTGLIIAGTLFGIVGTIQSIIALLKGDDIGE